MLHKNWIVLLLGCLVIVAALNGFLAAFTTFPYRKKSWGQLSHSQLRIKQGNATFDHRLNAFTQATLFCLFSWRGLFLSLLLWILVNALYYFRLI